MFRSRVIRLIVLFVAAMALSATALAPASNAAAPSSGGEQGRYVAPPPSGEYVPLSPVRLLDTRNTSPVGAQSSIDVKVTGVAGVPTSATAVVLNVTATQASAESFITVWPKGVPRPTASNLNTSTAVPTTANVVIAKVGNDGKVSLYNHAGSVHLIADIAGYYQPGSGYVPRSPTRLLDTRNTTKVGTDSIEFKVRGVAGVPASATAVVLNITATQPTEDSFITVWPMAARPRASNLNTSTAVPTTANLVIAKVGVEGTVSLYNHAGSVHLIVDVAGYYQPGPRYVPDSPVRLVDTRNTGPAVGAQSTIDWKVAGVAGVPSNATAVVLNITATQPSAESFITVWPKGTARPNASNLNTSSALPTTANLVIAKVGAEGKVSLYNHAGSVHLIADIAGYYTSKP